MQTDQFVAEFCRGLFILKYKMTNSFQMFLGQFIDGKKQVKSFLRGRNGETYPLASNWSKGKYSPSEWG